MNFSRKLKAVAVAAGACASLLVAGSANAYVYATSRLFINDLSIGFAGTTVSILGFTFDLTNTASMNGPSVVSGASCNSLGAPACSLVSPVLDAAAVNAPGSTLLRSNNVFGYLGTTPTDSYSGSDSVIDTATLVQGIPTSTKQIAESLLNVNGAAKANAEIQSNTGISLTFSAVGGGSMFITFSADPDMKAAVAGDPGLYLAQANLNVSMTLDNNTTGDSVSWAPQGTVAEDCSASGALSCFELSDTQDLNRNAGAALNPSTTLHSFSDGVFTFFGLEIDGLSDGIYTLTLNGVTSTSITRQVIPEPTSLALIGAALAGLGISARRRRQVQ